MGGRPLIKVEGLTKYYDDHPAIVDVTFSVPQGQVLGFLGPNGAGKSTTLRILSGYLSATSGRATIAGFDVFQQSREVRRRIGYLPETTPLYNEMRVDSYLETMCQLRGVPPLRRRAAIDRALQACGLVDFRHDIIGHLSRGLRQRVGLAQAVVHDPDLLILDEPTVGLDPAQTRETRELITELGARHTVILSSHILSEVSATCDRVLIIKEGRLVADDTPGNLSRRLGESRSREIEAVVKGDPVEIERRVRRLRGVQAVSVTAGDDGDHRVVVTGDRDDLQDALAKLIVRHGFGLLGLTARELTLEDVFLELTAEEAPSGAT
jgi:ABC-2 type transport system ATP-binding protein